MQNQQNEQNQSGINWRQILLFGLIYYFLFGGIGQQSQISKDPNTGQPLPPHQNIYSSGLFMDLLVYFSEKNESVSFDSNFLIWKEKNIVYGLWDNNTRKKSVQIKLTPTVQHNGSLYAHSFFMPKGSSPSPNASDYKTPYFTHVHQLNKYVKRITKARKNLISGEMDEEWAKRKEGEESETESSSLDKVEILSHWKGNFTLNIVQDFSTFPRGAIPEQIKKYMILDESGNYYPIVYGNDFWLLNEDLMIINDTVEVLQLDMLFEPLSLWRWSLYAQMEDSLHMQKNMMLGSTDSEGETENFKRLLMDNNPYILGLTVAISLLHTVLDILAFKNDIQFWRNKKSMKGLSIRTIYVNVICNLIVLLYLLDNETSWMILFSVGLGLLIETWKLTKAVQINISYTVIKGLNIPCLKFTDKNSYISSTKEHDLTAMKYLNYALYPLVLFYAIYSLYFESHKGWYSWIVSTLAGCVYTFGFIMMTPQLFINYKLKSVAHLPWRVFVYKAISTFIDDLFAFLIRMPTMHRLRVFRDDLVFIIYLYQRWIYPVDKTRIETGAEFEDATLEEIEMAKKEALALKMEEEKKKNQ